MDLIRYKCKTSMGFYGGKSKGIKYIYLDKSLLPVIVVFI